MSLLSSDAALAARRAVVAGPLEPLAHSLAADVEPLLAREIYFPSEKALLSREGGRCATDGTLLAFDPFSPHVHTCPRCGTEYRGERHYRFWIYWYQLWLAERAVHAAALVRLGVDERFRPLVTTILDGYGERYAQYPNVDNVLGPTRLFFSTYLESIWLLQICVAADLIAPRDPALADRARDRIIEPSRAIIREFDEGGSNRQIWNDAALLAAARILGDDSAIEPAVFGASGIVEQLSTGLLADGTWFEGDNYHLFAHRGLWYGVTMAEQAGVALPRDLLDRFQRGFSTVFATALPDLTFPSRRDSQYAASLRQWRIAEHVELGLARRADDELIGALERLYRDDIPRRDTGRRTSSADAERNGPPSALSRADLSWRALLCARPVLPPLVPVAPRSVLLERQGLAVFRRNAGRTYVALDYGHSGGSHGHPDRLNLLLVDGDTRWLDDPGTGSYVEDTLHWYRSTLAHNAPLVDGRSQPSMDGDLVAYEEGPGAGSIAASIRIGSTDIRRTLIVLDDHIVDRVHWQDEREVQFDLPIHADITFDESLAPGALVGGQGLEDGFRFLHDSAVATVDADAVRQGAARMNGRTLRVWTQSDRAAEWWRTVAPGAPGQPEKAFRLFRARGASGTVTTIYTLSADVTLAQFDTLNARLSTLEPRPSVGVPAPLERSKPKPAANVKTVIVPSTTAMGASHYRRSEQSWADAGRPTAQIRLEAAENTLRIEVRVPTSDRNFSPSDAINPYDNEPPDTNGDGIQLFIQTREGKTAWMLVPDGGSVRVRPIDGWRSAQSVAATWRAVGTGYEMTIDLPVIPDAIDVIVNEMPRGRERRRGQLVLSGGGGFVYLRGDRHEGLELLKLDVRNG
jgi:hypothetical protein